MPLKALFLVLFIYLLFFFGVMSLMLEIKNKVFYGAEIFMFKIFYSDIRVCAC